MSLFAFLKVITSLANSLMSVITDFLKVSVFKISLMDILYFLYPNYKNE